jgi:hypothetical protein
MLILTKKILQSYPNGFNSFLITGRRGIGKSSYSLRSLHDALVEMGMSNIRAWDTALKSLKFTIPEVIAYLKEAVDADEKKVCLIWDDTRIFASGTQYHLNMKLVYKLSGMLDSIRTAVCNLVMTCPSTSGLLGVLKSYDDYLCKIHFSHEGGFARISKGYLWSSLPSGQKRIYLKFVDSFNCRLPNWIYEKYMIQRKNALKDILVDLENKETAEKKIIQEKELN